MIESTSKISNTYVNYPVGMSEVESVSGMSFEIPNHLLACGLLKRVISYGIADGEVQDFLGSYPQFEVVIE